MGKIKINGEVIEIDNPVSVFEILKIRKVNHTDKVSVQLNGEFVDRAHFNVVNTNHGDRIDLMYFIGGGSYPHQVKYR